MFIIVRVRATAPKVGRKPTGRSVRREKGRRIPFLRSRSRRNCGSLNVINLIATVEKPEGGTEKLFKFYGSDGEGGVMGPFNHQSARGLVPFSGRRAARRLGSQLANEMYESGDWPEYTEYD